MKTIELEFQLAPSSAWTEIVTDEQSRKVSLGEVESIERWFASYRVFLGESPVGISADDAAGKLGMKLEPWAEIKLAGRRSWLIRNAFSLMSSGSLLEPDAVGLELIFRDDRRSINVGKMLHVHSLLPGPEFQELAGGSGHVVVDAKGRFVAQAKMAPTGSLQEEPADSTGGALLNAEGTLRAEAAAQGSVALRMSVCTTKVAAVGTGDRRAQWEFRKKQEPLIGHDIETWTGLLLDKDERSLTYQARVYAIFGGGPFRVTHTTKWANITCPLT